MDIWEEVEIKVRRNAGEERRGEERIGTAERREERRSNGERREENINTQIKYKKK